jgi:hypothetical protein
VLGSLFGFSFCGITLIFLYILSVYLEAHCAFFDIYNITYQKKKMKFKFQFYRIRGCTLFLLEYA